MKLQSSCVTATTAGLLLLLRLFTITATLKNVYSIHENFHQLHHNGRLKSKSNHNNFAVHNPIKQPQEAPNSSPSTPPSSPPQSQKPTDNDKDDDYELTKDIEFLHGILADVAKKEDKNKRIHALFTQLAKHGFDRASDPNNTKSLEQMKQLAKDLSPEDALGVLRVFSLALNLVNAAEVNHRLRKLQKLERDTLNKQKDLSSSDIVSVKGGPLPHVHNGVHGTIETILNNKEASIDEIYNQLTKQKVELVLTAHPTQVNRKTILNRYRGITETLTELDRPDLHPYQKSELIDKIKRNIAAAWGSDEIRRVKPTPQLEAKGIHAIVETVLWDAIPNYLRKLNAQCLASLGKPLPIDAVPIYFNSWVGGDRDGNPNVTPEVTREVLIVQRLLAAQLYLKDLDMLYSELAISKRFTKEMEDLAASITSSRDNREKYRRVIGHLRDRLMKTIQLFQAELNSLTSSKSDSYREKYTLYSSLPQQDSNDDDIKPITKEDELMKPLRIMYESLIETGFETIADGRLIDIIRRVSLFGVTLLKLDIREESTVHTNCLDSITRHLGLGSYKEWNEEARLNFLQSELTNKRPLFVLSDLEEISRRSSGSSHDDNEVGAIIDETVLKTLRVFQVASTLGGNEALGAYVISQARSTSDVLAVMLLQRQFGMTPESGTMMRVVPLFETLNDLTNAPDILKVLFNISQYVGAIKGKQEIMVGYSDSAKDAGRLAACWAQYTAQEKMVEVAKEHNVELTFFHGKGGTVGRGGNPALYRAILSHPPDTINGRFRVTEQGEMITKNFGSPTIAERNLDIYTAAVLRETFIKHVQPKKAWRDQMERISNVSCEDYRSLVRGDPRFVTYFRQATPELELGSLNIGSRPAKRNPKGGIESLRAIPWTFAWTQSRLHLSAWLGVGRGLSTKNEADAKELKGMYNEWPWFREIIDLMKLMLSKTDFSISKNYDDILVEKTDDLLNLGNEIRNKLVETRQAVLDVSGSTEYGGPHIALLRTATKIRNPYLDPINCLQVEIMKELRMMGEEESKIKNVRKDALIVSIKAMAQGMGNSG